MALSYYSFGSNEKILSSLPGRQDGELKGQCPDCAHARASSVFFSKDNRTVILTRQEQFFNTSRFADTKYGRSRRRGNKLAPPAPSTIRKTSLKIHHSMTHAKLKRLLSYFHGFSVFVWTGKTIRIRYAWMASFFKTEKKNLCFQKYAHTCRRGPKYRTLPLFTLIKLIIKCFSCI